jgi:hypothetical protein
MERTILYGERSQHIGELTKALARAQGAMRNAPRTQKGHFGQYADLATITDTIRKPLSDAGIAFTQEFLPFGDSWVLATELSHTSGEWKRSVLPINHRLDPQKFAASATYLKRIALSAIVGIAAEDEDDGETANRAVATDRVAGQARVAVMLEKTIRATKPDQMKVVVGKLREKVQSGELDSESGDRLEAIAREVAGKKPTGKRPEPAA